MKKVATLIMALTMISSVLFASGSKESVGVETTSSSDQFKAICLINGSLGDKGFFDSAAEGFDKFAQESTDNEVKIVEMGRNESSYESYFLDVSDQDWDVISTGTWSVLELTQEIAEQYPEKTYLFFDGSLNADNVLSITYKGEETGFMAGCLAALMLSTDDSVIDSTQRTLGFVGSMDTPNINDFLVGYIEGVQLIDPTIRVLTSYVGSFEDVPKCMEMTTQLYNQGAQIVYAPASQSVLGAVAASDKSDKYLIGCDTDLWNSIKDSDPEKVRNVISSSLKNVGESLLVALNGLKDGTMEVGKEYNLGIEAGAVGLAKNANYNKIVPQNVRQQLDEIAERVASGDIIVNKAIGRPTEDIAALRDSMKP